MQIIIKAPHFHAGYDIETGYIAPIIKFMKGWSIEEITNYCDSKNWECQIIGDPEATAADYYNYGYNEYYDG